MCYISIRARHGRPSLTHYHLPHHSSVVRCVCVCVHGRPSLTQYYLPLMCMVRCVCVHMVGHRWQTIIYHSCVWLGVCVYMVGHRWHNIIYHLCLVKCLCIHGRHVSRNGMLLWYTIVTGEHGELYAIVIHYCNRWTWGIVCYCDTLL